MSATIDDKIVAGAKNTDEVKEDPVVMLTEKVNALYLFRDHYFENHSMAEAINKNKDVEKEMKDTIAKFDEYKGYEIDGWRAKYYYLKGKALNVVEQFVPRAEELLSKAVKLEPKYIDAWNELGECYWKKDDIKQAKNCFLGALPHERNKVSLRNLSVILRQEPVEDERQKMENIKQGVEYAKEAVALDTFDGQSWGILGNAYLSSFFTIANNPATLKLCMSAYTQAEKDVVARSKPYLFSNKAAVLKYQEEYKLALEAYERAMSLDPTWDIPRGKREELIKYLNDLQKFVNLPLHRKSKKLHQMIQNMDKKYMGPYRNSLYTSGNKTFKLVLTPLKDLKEGLNSEKVVFGKVAGWIQVSDGVPFTFCLIDEEFTCVVVTVYNIAEGRGFAVGEKISIPEPFLTHHKFSYADNEYDFKSIRVETPLVLVLNGRKIGRDQQASAEFSSYKLTD